MATSGSAIPKGKTLSDRWKTGQRVPAEGWWEDQYWRRSYHYRHSTFPPCIGRKGECALRRYLGASWAED